MYNYYRDYEYRWRQRSRLGKESIELDIKDRDSIQKIFNISGGGQHYLGGSGSVLDYKLSFSQSGEKRPDELLSIFEQEDVVFDPNVSPDFIDPNNIRANPLNADINEFALDAIEYNNDETRDRDIVAAVNMLMPLPSGDQFNGSFKFGAKFRNKDVFQHQPLTLYESDDDLMLAGVLGFRPPSIINGRYTMSPFQDPDTMRSRYSDLDSEHDPESDAGNYDAGENVVAGYAMTDFNLNPKVRIMGGLRYEHTSNDYSGFTVTYDDEGDYEETIPNSNSSSYGTLSPMVHLTYHLADRTNLRMAVTRTLARPNYYDLVPYNIVIREDNEIERGNPDLDPTTAWNFDVLAEHYFESVGVVSGGFFYKSLDQYIYLFTVREEIDGSRWEISQPRNGESAKILGAEMAFQGQLRFLPSPFDGIGIYTNYTFSDSEAVFPDRNLVSTLPGQSKHVGNFAVWYEKGGFNGRVSLNFHGKYIDEVGGDELEDIYYDNHNQLDVTLSQAIGSRVRIFADFINLTNEPLRYYIGTADRPIQEEYYRWWANFGIKFNF
jgi:TonB-dependent receptor